MTTHQPDPPDDGFVAFERERGRLFGIAYRMLGSVVEAEDVLQDAYMRWHDAERATVENPSAFLVRLTTRLCLDVLKSARNQRTAYVGPWLPEPFVADDTDDPQRMQELADDLSTAFLLLLERLSPLERAVFLLRESFDFSFAEIAAIVGKTEPNCRQIARRARQHLGAANAPRAVDPAEHDRLLRLFFQATQHGDVEGMIAMLAPDAVLLSDGGGKVPAARQPIAGAAKVARSMIGFKSKLDSDARFRVAIVNGRNGLLVYVHDVLHTVVTVQIAHGLVQSLFFVSNPDKLPTHIRAADHSWQP